MQLGLTTRCVALSPYLLQTDVCAKLVGIEFDALVVVNRSPIREMQLEVAFVPGVKRVLEDGTMEDAARYGEVYRLDPGYAEIFVLSR